MTSRYFTIFPDFYPRPPRGGRQPSARMDFFKSGISIHALREEGDGSWGGFLGAGEDFYPRPPRGGRHTRIL